MITYKSCAVMKGKKMKNHEYNSLLKDKLEQIKIDNKDITDLTNSLNCRASYKN